jgi:MYXO-CTERM domain-containing protein
MKATNCKLLLIAALVILVGTVSAHATPTSAVAISGGTLDDDDDTNGWRFQALSDINVVSLGVWDESGDGLPADVDVGLWTDGGTLLGSVTVGSGTSRPLDDGFRYQDLLTAIPLATSQFYRVGSSANVGGIDYRGRVTVVSDPAIAYDKGYYASSSNSLTFPSTAAGTSGYFFGGNFQFEAVPEPAVPEPAGLALVGLAALTLRRKRR